MYTRRNFLSLGAAAGALATAPINSAFAQQATPDYRARYVKLGTGFEPFNIHVIPDEFALYWTLPDREAIRYSVGVAREGLYEAGTFTVGAKKEWPSWTPTPEMIAREPHIYAKFADGVPGGPTNPLGARALYLFTPSGYDSMLRIHGTQDDTTIGRPVSNGCARLTNGYVIDLYNRVPIGTQVYLHPKRGSNA